MMPQKYMEIMSMFQKALKTGDYSNIELISLQDLMDAKAHLSKDKDSPYYELLLNKIREKELQQVQKSNEKDRTLIFISYDNRDLPLVMLIDNILKRIFDNKIRTFIARRDIEAGEDAFRKILYENLSKNSAVLAIYTKQSMYSPWLWFESGAGFGSGSVLIPILAGVTSEEVKYPMKIFQGKQIIDKDEVKELISTLSKITGIKNIDDTFTGNEFENIKKIIASLDISVIKKRAEDNLPFSLPYPDNFKDKPINFIIEATFNTSTPIPAQQLNKLLNECKIKINDNFYYPSSDEIYVSHHTKNVWLIHSLEQEDVANEIRQSAVFCLKNLVLLNWVRRFYSDDSQPQLIRAEEINRVAIWFIFYCKKICAVLGLKEFNMRVRLFDLQNGLLSFNFAMQGYGLFRPPKSNEIEVEQIITILDHQQTKSELSIFLMHIWEHFTTERGHFPELIEEKLLEYYDQISQLNNLGSGVT